MSKELDLNLSEASFAIMRVNATNMEIKITDASRLELTGNVGNLEMEVLGASNVKINDNFMSENMEMKVRGASFLDARQLNVDKVNAKVSGASKVFLKGVAKTCDLDLSGASKLEASDLDVKDYELEISGASSANIWCMNSISIEASGASSLKYKGNPVTKKMKITGASSVKSIN